MPDVEAQTDSTQVHLELAPDKVDTQTATETKEHWSTRLARTGHRALGHVGANLFLGLVTAVALKTVGRILFGFLIVIAVAFQFLAYYGYVDFKWSKVQGSLQRRLDLNKDGKVNLKDCGPACGCLWQTLKWLMGYGLLTVIGFALGFYLGWKLV